MITRGLHQMSFSDVASCHDWPYTWVCTNTYVNKSKFQLYNSEGEVLTAGEVKQSQSSVVHEAFREGLVLLYISL